MTVPGFTEEWFGEFSQQTLADLVREVADVNGLLVEVGSWEGRSTIAMANAAYPREVHAVDTWHGSPGEISATLAAERDVYAQFSTNILHFTQGNVVPHRMGWRDYFAEMTDPVALCFIDAEHTYDEVRANIEAVEPLLVSGGILCGDDMHHEPVRLAVLDTLGTSPTALASLWIWRKP